jgi:hypothetical protein
MQTDGQTNMAKLLQEFLQAFIANAPKRKIITAVPALLF